MIPITPRQPFVPMVRLKEMAWPESLTCPMTWTDDTVLRSVVAWVAIWSAVNPDSGLPDADADALVVALDVAEVLEAPAPQAVAVPRIAAPRKVAATARRLTWTDVRIVLLPGQSGAKDQVSPSIYRSRVQQAGRIRPLLPKRQPMSRRRSPARPTAENARAARHSQSSGAADTVPAGKLRSVRER